MSTSRPDAWKKSHVLRRATELALDSQLYAFALRLAHPLLSTQDGRDEEHFACAEELRRVMKLEPSFDQLCGADLSPNAQLALGDHYEAWERPKDATAHEEALKLNLSLQEAKRKLEETRQE